MVDLNKYHLQIVFMSNERPWKNDCFEPYPRFGMNREEAIVWARGMAEGLTGYQVTLFENDIVLDYKQKEPH